MSTITNAATTASKQVFSTPPLSIAETCRLVSWSRRSTTQNPVDAANRYRGIVVESAALAIAPDACTSKFQRLLQSTIHNLADAMFQAWATDNLPALEYDGAAITTDSVLMFWADKKSKETIDGAAILAWLEASETWKILNDKQRAAWKTLLPKIAAPSYRASFTVSEATKLAARIVESDGEHATGLFILQRLANIMQTVSREGDL